ncbi:MAG: hypothetical protein H6622_12600 [Halobacteriovoraceae bacterium]|nr:hypothetical protein [Halobacteriovoraceae bacterium]
MDLTILSKKISSYRTPKGKITNLPDELLGEILFAWEQWTGAAYGFYKALGVDQRKMAKLMGKAKQLKREGFFDGLDFSEVIVEVESEKNSVLSVAGKVHGIELVWDNSKIIRFSDADLLLDFLKKAA